jgi:hypothetical protein
MDDIKPVNTPYMGFWFRSRLEARYAVYFDALGIKYEYEKEGYSLGELGWYLPDFWLPQFNCWAEIKPINQWSTFCNDDFHLDNKVETIARSFRDNIAPIIVFGGIPTVGWNGMAYCYDMTDSSGGTYENQVGFDWCAMTAEAVLSFTDEDVRLLRGDRVLYTNGLMDTQWDYRCRDGLHRRTGSHFCYPIMKAANKAKSARFEHGGKA